MRWFFATSLTGHLVYAGYNLTWVLATILVTIQKQNFLPNVKLILTISLLVFMVTNMGPNVTNPHQKSRAHWTSLPMRLVVDCRISPFARNLSH